MENLNPLVELMLAERFRDILRQKWIYPNVQRPTALLEN